MTFDLDKAMQGHPVESLWTDGEWRHFPFEITEDFYVKDNFLYHDPYFIALEKLRMGEV